MGRPVRCRRTACVVFQGVLKRKEGFNAVGWFGSLQLLVYIASRAGEGVACSIGAVDGNVPCLVMVKCSWCRYTLFVMQCLLRQALGNMRVTFYPAASDKVEAWAARVCW